MKALGAVLAVLGMGALAAAFDAPSRSEALRIATGALLLLAWGGAAWRYAARGRRGGAASIVGGALLGLGLWGTLGAFAWEAADPAHEGAVRAVAAALLAVAGAALLHQGRRVDRRARAEPGGGA